MRRNMMAAVVLLAGLCLFAPITVTKADTAEASSVATGDNGAYTVTVPAVVAMTGNSDGSKSAEIPIEAELESNTNLVINITSANYDKEKNGFYLNNGDESVKYTISDNKSLFFSNETGENATQKYKLEAKCIQTNFKYSGDYTDTLTFTMSSVKIGDDTKGKHCLTFNVNAGNDRPAEVSTSKKILAEGEAYGTLPTPRRTGYDFMGWYTNQEEASENSTDATTLVNENTKMDNADVELYAKWKIHTFHNTMTFWAWGFQNKEGNNGSGNALRLSVDKSVEPANEYGSTFQYTVDMASHVKVPKGYELKQFGSATVPGSFIWKRYNFINKTFSGTQPDWAVNAEYEYDLIKYNITYNMDGGSNNKDNPSTYTVLYGVTFADPTKEGYTFDGWYIDDKKVTGINENCVNDFSSEKTNKDERFAESATKFYAALESRTAKDLTVTAHWKQNQEPGISDDEKEINSQDSINGDTSEITSPGSDTTDNISSENQSQTPEEAAEPETEEISEMETETEPEPENADTVKIEALPESKLETEIVVEAEEEKPDF